MGGLLGLKNKSKKAERLAEQQLQLAQQQYSDTLRESDQLKAKQDAKVRAQANRSNSASNLMSDEALRTRFG